MSNYLLQSFLSQRIKSEQKSYGVEIARVESVRENGLIIDCLPLVKNDNTQAIRGVLVAQNKYVNFPIAKGDYVMLLKSEGTLSDFASSGNIKESQNTYNYLAISISCKKDFQKDSELIRIGNENATLKDLIVNCIDSLNNLTNILKTSFSQPAINGKPLDPAFSASVESFSSQLKTLQQKVEKVLK